MSQLHRQQQQQQQQQQSKNNDDDEFVQNNKTDQSTAVKETKPVHLITFDLDDTLFPINQVIRDANGVMLDTINRLLLTDLGCSTAELVEVTQDEFHESMKSIRQTLDKQITYTELRQRAIKYIIKQRQQKQQQRHNNSREDNNNRIMNDNDLIVNDVYNQWEKERHISAERHLYPDVILMLQQLKGTYPNVVIGAITNGKGSPFMMTQTIAPYFDFCISGEDDGVFPSRKPHCGIYDASVRRYREICRERRLDCEEMRCDETILEKNSSGTRNSSDDDNDDGTLIWFHVGDDLANDVGGSAACGARAIWADLLDEYGQTASKRFSVTSDGVAQQPAWSTISRDDLNNRRKMSEMAKSTAVTDRIERLSDLTDVIMRCL